MSLSLSADENAPTVRRIFSEYASSGRSLASIAKELSKEKSASAARSRGSDSKSLSRMLRPPVYTSADRAVLACITGIWESVRSPTETRNSTAHFTAHIVGKRSSSDICKQSDVAAHSVAADEFPRYCRLRYLASLPAAPGSEQTARQSREWKVPPGFPVSSDALPAVIPSASEKPAAGAVSAASGGT